MSQDAEQLTQWVIFPKSEFTGSKLEADCSSLGVACLVREHPQMQQFALYLKTPQSLLTEYAQSL